MITKEEFYKDIISNCFEINYENCKYKIDKICNENNITASEFFDIISNLNNIINKNNGKNSDLIINSNDIINNNLNNHYYSNILNEFDFYIICSYYDYKIENEELKSKYNKKITVNKKGIRHLYIKTNYINIKNLDNNLNIYHFDFNYNDINNNDERKIHEMEFNKTMDKIYKEINNNDIIIFICRE